MKRPEMFHDRGAPVQANQYAAEFGELLKIYRQRKPRRVLEIGSAQGGTLYQWIRNAAPGASVTAVDLPGGPFGLFDGRDYSANWLVWARLFGVDFEYLLADSTSAQALEFMRWRGPFDWIFIDGDHSYSGAKQDFFNSWRFMAEDGVIVLHDVCPHLDLPTVEVDRLWLELKERFFTVEIRSDPEQRDRGIGMIYGYANDNFLYPDL